MKYPTDEDSRKAHIEDVKRWNKNNPEKFKEYQKTYAQKHETKAMRKEKAALTHKETYVPTPKVLMSPEERKANVMSSRKRTYLREKIARNREKIEKTFNSQCATMQIEIIDTKYGKMMVNAKDDYVGQSLIRYGQYCEGEVALLLNLISNETIVVDIGANIGALTIPFARFAKKVYAFEPHPQIFKLLCGNIALNQLNNVECFNIGIGEKNGTMYYQDLEDFSHNNGAHSLINSGDDTCAIHITNSVPSCGVLKIDVEGMELDVLRGCRNMIETCKPFMFVENDRREKSDNLIQFIVDDLHYKAWWAAWTLFDENNFFFNQENMYGEVGCINMICIPEEVDFDFATLGLKPVIKGGWYKD